MWIANRSSACLSVSAPSQQLQATQVSSLASITNFAWIQLTWDISISEIQQVNARQNPQRLLSPFLPSICYCFILEQRLTQPILQPLTHFFELIEPTRAHKLTHKHVDSTTPKPVKPVNSQSHVGD
jgi:hypothetical protein